MAITANLVLNLYHPYSYDRPQVICPDQARYNCRPDSIQFFVATDNICPPPLPWLRQLSTDSHYNIIIINPLG